jgi:ABC-type polysaccharide/polyol phosphate transport system ATPase subunit
MRPIEVEDLWVSYRVKQGHPRTLLAVVGTLGKSLPRREWALKGVSFSVEEGETLGVIGMNGSGKSTLLRSVAGIFRPSKGKVIVRGNVSSLIDLTAGFEMDLSARENVILSGAIYGLSRREIREVIGEVFMFAGLEEHADSALRTFSTGMAMRLGFSIAVALDPDVILVDEVLAVGDESFKHRCLEKIGELRSKGTTIMFASHELSLVETLCDRALVLDQGELAHSSGPVEAVDYYCERLGVTRDDILHRPVVQDLQALDRPWSRRRRR